MQKYHNEHIIVRFDKHVCIHSAECINGLPQVFDIHKRPWVNVNGADAETIRRQIERCPSSALTCETIRPETTGP